MMEKFDSIKKQLTELAGVLNEFKSEAVQLRILDLVLGEQVEGQQPASTKMILPRFFGHFERSVYAHSLTHLVS